MELNVLQEKLESRRQIFSVYRNQVNKDLERSSFEIVKTSNPGKFLEDLVDLLNEAIEDSDPKLQQLYYLADVQEKHLEHGIVMGFIYREWVKIKYRLGQ